MAAFRVTRAYRTPYGGDLAFRAGQQLAFEHRPSEWKGWIWCTSDAGASAWVPESWVRIEGARCVMTRDYVARELSVAAGDGLSGTVIESGWVWATAASGASGWVPLDHLEPV